MRVMVKVIWLLSALYISNYDFKYIIIPNLILQKKNTIPSIYLIFISSNVVYQDKINGGSQ